MSEEKKKRNRSAEAKERGLILRAFTIGADTDRAIDDAVKYLKAKRGDCTKVQALEWLVSEGRKKIPRKTVN